MSNTKKLATAALAGLFSIGTLAASAALAGEHDKSACNGTNGCKGKGGAMEKAADEKEKHACKGQNSCKGNGADGKNECKGHGSCATDGSK